MKIRKKRKLNRVLAAAACLILLCFILAPSIVAINFNHVTLNITVGEIMYSSGIGVQSTMDDNVSYHEYTSGQEVNLIGYDFIQVKGMLNAAGQSSGFNGFFVSLVPVSNQTGPNEIMNYFSSSSFIAVATSNGYQYFIPDQTYMILMLNCEAYIMTFTPAFYDPTDGGYGGYTVGYDAGFTAGANSKNLEIQSLQNQLNNALAALEERDSFDYEAFAQENFIAGQHSITDTTDYVEEVVSTSLNGFGNLMSTMLSLEVFGIKLYAIVLTLCILPLSIWILKLVTHR